MTTLCGMCEESYASQVRGFPVCSSCSEAMDEVQKELESLEKDDPRLKKLSDNVDIAMKAYLDDAEGD